MKEKIKIGILGYGNVGKGVEIATTQSEDMELSAVFTRRDANTVHTLTNTPVVNISEIANWKDKIDVMILCGGSATDLPEQGPKYASLFNTIDSFDTHKNIPEYFEKVDKAAKQGDKLAIISIGWDPGLFSLNRLFAETILPQGNTYTFWGKGVSQGHSDAIRRIKGVKNAIQYTIPLEEAVETVRRGENVELTPRQKHIRECFVVIEEGEDEARIEREIKTMPNYFDEYDTIVHFITEEELKANHSKMPHGGFVIRSGNTGINHETKQIIEYSLNLESNPEFTGSILVCYARAAYRLQQKGEVGAKTIFDIAPNMLSMKTNEQLIKEML